MNEISNHFFLLPQSLVSDALLYGQMVALDTDTKEFSATGPILFDQTPSEGDGGVTWRQTFRAVTLDPAVLDYGGARFHPAFRMSDGTIRVIGTHDSAPMITVTPSNGGRYLVQAAFDAPEALVL